MPYGTNDIAVAAGSATNLINALFAPEVRNALPVLMGLANDESYEARNDARAAAYLALPAVPAGAPAPAAVQPFPRAPVASFVSLLNPAELQTMLGMWWQIWNTAPGGLAPVGSNASDVAFLNCLRDYIADPEGNGATQPLVLWEPEVVFDGIADGKLKLRLAGYTQYPLLGAGPAWIQASVVRLLSRLAFGAHFVAIHAPGDLAAGAPRSFFDVFAAALGAQSATARMHSHYSGAKGLTNLFAHYSYPNINQETAPANCPYVTAMLVGRTDWSMEETAPYNWETTEEYNTFFQLEGWPATGLIGIGLKPKFSLFPIGIDGGRHGADFDTHNATKWNISTYGASIFSEKRGTTIFLAPPPPAWTPAPANGTIMTPYAGAATAQGWLDTSLIRL